MIIIYVWLLWIRSVEAEFDNNGKNQGYNKNHICNISNFSKLPKNLKKKSKFMKMNFDIFEILDILFLL